MMSNNNIKNKEELLEQLSESERELALSILKDISQKGYSETYNKLLYEDYEEIPVDITTFVHDKKYLGKGLTDDEGRFTLYPYWEEMLKKIYKNPLEPAYYNTLALTGSIGIGKCNPLDTPVLTENGFIPMGEVKVGTKVYGRDGELHNVIQVFPHKNKEIYKVYFSDGTNSKCGEDHLWQVTDHQESNIKVIDTKYLIEQNLEYNSQYRFEIPLCEPINFKNEFKSLCSHTLGLMIGDDSFTIEGGSDKLINIIKELGLYRKTAPDKFIPQKYLYTSTRRRIELLQGLLDTSEFSDTANYTTPSFQLCKDMIWLVQSLGGIAEYTKINNSYNINITLPSNIPPFQSEKKLAIYNSLPHNKPIRYITKIEKLEQREDAQCIYIDGDEHLYIVNDFIVTHNTLIAVVIGCYELYRMLCLKDPYTHYGLQPIDLISFAVMNITKDAAHGVAWSKLQALIQSSSWFMARGTLSRNDIPEWKPPKGIELIYGSQSQAIIGRAIYWAFFDEVSFQRNLDVEKQKQKAKTLITSAIARMQSRFMKGEKNPTILILASSKRTDQSYMEIFIEEKKKNESKTTLVVDEPQWVIRTDKDSPRKFYVAVGNKFLNSEVLPLNISEKDLQIYKDKGFTILQVPMGYYENFLDDLDIALTDIAGISTSNTMRYISGPRWAKLRKEELGNPFTKEILEVGNSADDKVQYYDFFDLSKVDPAVKERPLYIHLDMSISGDKTGIAGVWIVGKKAPTEGQPPSKDLFYRLAFSVAIKAKKGHQISFEKNRQFIYWLKEQGFNIKGISTDTFQSYDTGQSLKSKGYNYDVLSVDRVQDRVCKPYQYFKNTIYEERLEVYSTKLLTNEVIGLVRDNNGKIDHTSLGGGIDSKDICDAVCGSIYNASQHAEEYAFDYGENLEMITQVNDNIFNDQKQQLVVDFESELNRAFDPLGRRKLIEDSKQTSEQHQSTIPKPQAMPGMYIKNGIMIW